MPSEERERDELGNIKNRSNRFGFVLPLEWGKPKKGFSQVWVKTRDALCANIV